MEMQSKPVPEEHPQQVSHPFRLTIDKGEINHLHLQRYTGPIEVVRDDVSLGRALRELKRERILGFDTETRPSFRKGESYLPTLIQLGGESKVYIFYINHLENLGKLYKILANPNIVKAGVAVDYDIRQLQELLAFQPAGFRNLEDLTDKLGIKKNGLRNLAAIVLGFRLSKSEQRSNWARDPLTRQQIAYAATDAWVSREIYLKLSEALENGKDDVEDEGERDPEARPREPA